MRSAIEQISDALEPSRYSMIDVLNHKIDLNIFVEAIAQTMIEGVFRTAEDIIAEAATRCINEAVERTVRCPKCKSKLALPDAVTSGSLIQCPSCRQAIRLKGPASPAQNTNQPQPKGLQAAPTRNPNPPRPQSATKSPAQNPPTPSRVKPPQPAAGATNSPPQNPNPQDKLAFGATRYNQVEAQQMLVGLQRKVEDVYKSKLGSNPKQLQYQLQLFNNIMKAIQKTIGSVKGTDSDGKLTF